MNIDRSILRFMRECLNNDVLVVSWGITQVMITETEVSFYVSGFKFSGEIRITFQGAVLILNSSKEYIGKTHDPKAAIYILDQYIEASEADYLNLYQRILLV